MGSVSRPGTTVPTIKMPTVSVKRRVKVAQGKRSWTYEGGQGPEEGCEGGKEE